MSGSLTKSLSQEFGMGTVLDATVTAESHWLLAGWVEVTEPHKWAYLAGKTADGRTFTKIIADRFSADAFQRQKGCGWIGFEVNLARFWPKVRGETLRFLCMKSDALVFEYDVPDLDLPERAQNRRHIDVRDFVLSRHLQKSEFSLGKLRLYLDGFVLTAGVEEFVRRAYVYILGREADRRGFADSL